VIQHHGLKLETARTLQSSAERPTIYMWRKSQDPRTTKRNIHLIGTLAIEIVIIDPLGQIQAVGRKLEERTTTHGIWPGVPTP